VSRCAVSIVKIYKGDDVMVRIKIVRAGGVGETACMPLLLAHCEMSLEDYARATLGQSDVLAELVERKSK
jgi:hypothetical protein